MKTQGHFASGAPVGPVIAVNHLTQRYGRVTALDSVSLTVAAGGVVGLLGPNGAGKSTLIRTVATLMPAKSGAVSVLGHPLTSRAGVRAVRSALGYLPQGFTADETMSAADFVGYQLWLRGTERGQIGPAVTQALARCDLGGSAHTRLSRLSGGMRQRVGIAAAIAGEPPLIVLDEPTVGLDPAQRSSFREMVRALNHSSVLLSTHLVEDVVSLCNQVIVVNEGRIAYSGTPQVLSANGESIDAVERAYLGLLRGA